MTRLSGYDMKVNHPDYHQLLIEDPRGAGAAIRADYRAWMAEAEAYVRARRGDVVIPGRWAVERTFGWLMHRRRLAAPDPSQERGLLTRR